MISLDLAARLAVAGMPWIPSPGDRFVLTTPGMEHDLFYLADMVADLHHFVDGAVVGFNGTTEWALDSVDLDRVRWLPREDQLRDALGPSFAALTRDGTAYVVTVQGADLDARPDHPGREGSLGTTPAASGTHSFRDDDVECAYAAALLAVLTH